MLETNYQKVSCPKCSGHIEFPSDAQGTRINCPHCGEPILLGRRKSSTKIISGVVMGLILAVVASLLWFRFRASEANSITTLGDIRTNEIQNPKVITNPAVASHVAAISLTNVEVVTTNKLEPVKPPPKSLNDLSVGKITLQKKQGSSLTYAVGTVKNISVYQHFGVKVELELFDDNAARLGTTQDYIAIIEPHKSWTFHALVTAPKSSVATLRSITEE